MRLAGTSFDVPVAWASVVGVLAAVIALAAVIGLALLHGVLARVIVVPTREAQLTEQARTSGVQRDGAIRASEVERTRIERDLHDGVQPRLVSVGMALGLAQQKMDDDPEAAKALLAEAHTSTKAAITELRQLARGIHASVLDDRGLDAALSALAGRSHIPVHLDVRVDTRCDRNAEAAVYFAIAETLTNAAKHSRASECRVVVRQRDGGTLWARVEDNGIGGAQVIAGRGTGRHLQPHSRRPRNREARQPAGWPDVARGERAMRILICEDSVLLREGLVRLLEDAGHEVVAALPDAGTLDRGGARDQLPTSASSTCGCRRRSPTRASVRRSDCAHSTRRSPCSCSRSMWRSATRPS